MFKVFVLFFFNQIIHLKITSIILYLVAGHILQCTQARSVYKFHNSTRTFNPVQEYLFFKSSN